MNDRNAIPRRPTIDDVAKLAGVSRSTTARALSGSGYAAADVRDRVLSAAEQLGYVADSLAGSLRSRKSTSVGVLVSNMRDPFYAALAAGIGQRAQAAGYTMIVIDDRESTAEEMKAARVFVGMRVGGVIVTPLSKDVGEYFRSQHIPVVEVDRTFGVDATDAVLIDNVGASRRLLDLLIGLGHRRIALLTDELYWTTGAGRFRGYSDALAAAGLEVQEDLVVSVALDVEAARASSVELLTQPDRPTAVFAANSLLTEGLWRATADLGLRVPEDLSIVAFDDAPWMSMVSPGVTAVSQDIVGLGEASMTRLLARMSDPSGPRETIVVNAQLLARGSTAPPRDHS
ncbi:LacI family transcriptional regulator [Herbiconiux moechotypicola]|uniref:LacI family DNA-binding transcriptional regulator n=1 Tax=Herbiconiux moechotypicola TaxID=637393 RepID=A0ABN3E2K5_9MICO|nr:LacI family DNA-binding transcriptional regulator [Herbiconiux moechotypicola]MCS5731539.1 LacI family transcriptional regulator [Herbiconiux moechotypicola]